MIQLTRALRRRVVVAVALLALGGAAGAQDGAAWRSALEQGTALRRAGHLTRALEQLEAAERAARTPTQRAITDGELGAALAQVRRFEEAQRLLGSAHRQLTGAARGRVAADLGNLEALRRNRSAAERYYREARSLAGTPAARAAIDLNLARLVPDGERLAELERLAPTIAALADPVARGRLYLNLGVQAQRLGQAGLPLAWRSLDRARSLLAAGDDRRGYAEALAALAALYEGEGRRDDATALGQQALARARALPPEASADLIIELEWQQGRLLRAAGDDDAALAAFQRAVDQVEAVRQDLPIEYDDGRSSFQATLAPVYLGLADLLLKAADAETGEPQQARLRQVTAVVELTRQAEMQDFLGDRCVVESTRRPRDRNPPPKTAVLYPIAFPDRVELVLEREGGLSRRTIAVPGSKLQAAARNLAEALRAGDAGFLAPAGQLYDWLLRPFDALLAERPVDVLVFVPDGALRLIPVSVLHDGQTFLLERMATATVIGLSMTNAAPPPRRRLDSLIAGMSEPGPVVGKLDESIVRGIEGAPQAAGAPAASIAPTVASEHYLRSARQQFAARTRSAPAGSEQRLADLREALALPGVKEEVTAVSGIVKGRSLLDSGFTVDNFRDQAGSGLYQVVHIASHGLFGGTASTSFIMAYDDLLTLDDLQTVLRAEKLEGAPVELLALSACETAEGDDRSPLGISGAAIKARAKSVLGTLWPVDDRAARTVMELFYEGLQTGGLSKAQALRAAQLQVLGMDGFAPPFYWAPFILIGNWL
jgi:CHAT domain-containing protein